MRKVMAPIFKIVTFEMRSYLRIINFTCLLNSLQVNNPFLATFNDLIIALQRNIECTESNLSFGMKNTMPLGTHKKIYGF